MQNSPTVQRTVGLLLSVLDKAYRDMIRFSVIINFRDAETAKIFRNEVSRKFPADIQATALRKLLQIHAAVSLESLRVPPGNRLEALKHNRAGQHSIRVNTAFASTINGAFALSDSGPMRKKWKSWTIIETPLKEE